MSFSLKPLEQSIDTHPPSESELSSSVNAFLSYSRADDAFANTLVDALEAGGTQVSLDRTDIVDADAWRVKLQSLIEEADAFVFVISTRSVASPECQREIAHAALLGKRFVTILLEPVPWAELPAPIAQIQAIDARGVEPAAVAQRVRAALETDQAWARFHTRLGLRAREWQARQREPSLLPRGAELEAAEATITANTARRPRLTPDQADFIAAARRAAIRRGRYWMTGLSIGIAVALGLAGFAAWNWREAVRANAVALSRQLSAQSVASRDEQLDRALLLAMAAADEAPTSEAGAALLHALIENPGVETYLRGHSDGVRALVADPDGETAYSADLSGGIRRWDIPGERAVWTVSAGGDTITSLALLGDRTRLAVGTGGGDVLFVRAASGQVETTLSPAPLAEGPAFIASGPRVGSLLVAYRSGELYLIEPRDAGWAFEPLTMVDVPITALAAAGDGRRIAIGTDIGTLGVVDVSSDLDVSIVAVRQVATPTLSRPGTLNSVGVSSDGRWVAASGSDGAPLVFATEELQDGAPLKCPRHDNDVYAIQFSADDRRLFTAGNDGRIHISSLGSDCRIERTLQANARSVMSLGLVAGETQRLLAGSGDGSVVVWRLDGKPLFGRSVRRSAHLVFRLDPAPDGSRLALAGMSESKGFVQLYEPTALAELGQPTTTGPGPASGVHFIDAGDPLVATLSGIERLQWFSQAQPAAKPVLETGAGVPGTGIDSTRRWLGVVQRDGVVRLVDTKDMSERWRTALSSGGRAQRFPAVARDGRRVAVGTDSFHVVLLDGATGRPFGEPAEGHRLEVTALAFDPVRPVLYSSSLDGSVRQWTASTGTSLGSIGDAGGAVQTIAVAPDGGVLAAATHDATVVLWELPSRRELAKLRGDLEGPVTALAFSPTGDELFAADMAGHLVAWPAREDGWRQLACAIAGRNLTEAEAEAFLGRSKAPELCSLATNQE